MGTPKRDDAEPLTPERVQAAVEMLARLAVDYANLDPEDERALRRVVETLETRDRRRMADDDAARVDAAGAELVDNLYEAHLSAARPWIKWDPETRRALAVEVSYDEQCAEIRRAFDLYRVRMEMLHVPRRIDDPDNGTISDCLYDAEELARQSYDRGGTLRAQAERAAALLTGMSERTARNWRTRARQREAGEEGAR